MIFNCWQSVSAWCVSAQMSLTFPGEVYKQPALLWQPPREGFVQGSIGTQTTPSPSKPSLQVQLFAPGPVFVHEAWNVPNYMIHKVNTHTHTHTHTHTPPHFGNITVSPYEPAGPQHVLVLHTCSHSLSCSLHLTKMPCSGYATRRVFNIVSWAI